MASSRARTLRKNLTDTEHKLWSALRRRQLDHHRFRRQHPIGPYVIDFVCLAAKLVVEVDGGQHGMDVERDAERTRWLEARGYRVLRFWNSEVLSNVAGVVETIQRVLRAQEPPPPLPSPSRGEGTLWPRLDRTPSPLEGES